MQSVAAPDTRIEDGNNLLCATLGFHAPASALAPATIEFGGAAGARLVGVRCSVEPGPRAVPVVFL